MLHPFSNLRLLSSTSIILLNIAVIVAAFVTTSKSRWTSKFILHRHIYLSSMISAPSLPPQAQQQQQKEEEVVEEEELPPITSAMSQERVVKIGIIGAGPAGLVAARVLSRTIEQFKNNKTATTTATTKIQFEITVLEKENDIGGVWNYNQRQMKHVTCSNDNDNNDAIPKKKDHPMYRNLRTNLPKEIMAYREYPWSSSTTTAAMIQQQSQSDVSNTDTATTTETNDQRNITHDDTTNTSNNTQSYVSHSHVYQYLYNYCQQYQLQQYIHYNCTVQQLTCLLPAANTTTNTNTNTTKSYFSPPEAAATFTTRTSSDESDDEEDVWPQIQLTWKRCSPSNRNNVNDKNDFNKTGATTTAIMENEIESDIFDAVVICNGHYSLPTYPTANNNIPGLQEFFQGYLIHSMEYDVPDPFVGQTILCIGGRASGSDIAREISNLGNGTRVYLSDTTFPTTINDESSSPSLLPAIITQGNVSWVPKTIRILKDGRVQFDSDIIEPIYVDTIILCTGYEYDFPFINESSNMGDFVTNDRRVQLLYEQLWYASAPNIVFIGIPHSVIPFPLFEFQCEAVVQSWFHHYYAVGNDTADSVDSTTTTINHLTTATRRMSTLPGKIVRYEKANIDANSGGFGKPNGRIPQDTHYFGSYQWEYCRTMAKYANIYNNNIESYIATNKAIWDHSGLERKGESPGMPDLYRSSVYERSNDDLTKFRVVKVAH